MAFQKRGSMGVTAAHVRVTHVTVEASQRSSQGPAVLLRGVKLQR
jgi:hypothetical protein